MNFFDHLFFAFWFFLPAGLANMFPIFAAHAPLLRKWNFPMDFYINFRGRALFGENKTMRGLAVAVLMGVLTVIAQKAIYPHWPYLQTISVVNYSAVNTLLLGLLLGLGAILGDAVESFFKRQLNIPVGSSWFFFDQIDYVLGGIIFSYFYVPLELKYYLYIALLYFVLHLASSAAGYLLGFKKSAI